MLASNADKLIVALLVNDMIEAINLAMRVRKAQLTINYTGKDHLLRVYLEVPGAPRETWMVTNTRSKWCHVCEFANPHIQLLANDVQARLKALGGSLLLVGYKPRMGKPVAKLQLIVEGSQSTAVTLSTVPAGGQLHCDHFIKPFGGTP